MNNYNIIKLQDRPVWKDAAAKWFHQKWKIPLEAYQESIEECLSGQSDVPQWYVMLDEDEIIAGLGVIENDFHNRKDLSPNICAYRLRGVELIRFSKANFPQYCVKMLADKPIISSAFALSCKKFAL